MIHKTWHIYVIRHFGSTGKSTPRSMKKNSYFVNLSWLQLDLNFTTMSSNSDSGLN